MFEQTFDGLIHIVGCLEAGVVLNDLGGGDAGICCVHMRENLAGGDVGIADVAGSDSTVEDIINSANEEFF